MWVFFHLYGHILFVPVAIALTLAYEYRRIDREFIRSQEDLQGRLARLDAHPLQADFTFKGMPAMCYDNTWRIAVSEFVKRADALLMDLRGFSGERKGCEYEVDFLLDTMPINQILFMVDSESDRDLVRRLITDRWAELRTTSPNLDLPDPTARLYVSGEQDGGDVQGLLDQLLAGAMAAKE